MPIEPLISVYLQNRVGSLNELCLALSERGINIRAISTTIELEWCIAGILVEADQVEQAKSIIDGLEIKFAESKVLTLEIENRPGALAKTTKQLSELHINILHANMTQAEEKSILVLMTTDNERAAEVLG